MKLEPIMSWIGCGVRKGRRKAARKREFNLPWREAGPPNHLDDEVDSDRQVINNNKKLLLGAVAAKPAQTGSAMTAELLESTSLIRNSPPPRTTVGP